MTIDKNQGSEKFQRGLAFLRSSPLVESIEVEHERVLASVWPCCQRRVTQRFNPGPPEFVDVRLKSGPCLTFNAMMTSCSARAAIKFSDDSAKKSGGLNLVLF